MLYIPPLIPPFYLQTAEDVKTIITTNDATIQGVLIGVIIGLSGALMYVYREKNQVQAEYIQSLKNYGDKMREVANQQSETLQTISNMLRK